MSLVTITPLRRVHAEAVQRLAEDPRIPATTNLPEPYPELGARAFIEYIMPRHDAGVEYAFAVLAAPQDGSVGAVSTLVGACGLVMPDAIPEDTRHGLPMVAELGYWIGVPYWGRGYATAACRELLAFGFGHAGLDAIDAYPLAENAASRRVLAKLGFTLVQVVPNKYPKWPAERVLAQYRLTRARHRA